MARLEDLRNEYTQTTFHLRTLAGFRLGLLSFFVIFVGSLLRGLWEIYIADSRGIATVAKIIVPSGAFLGTFLIYMVDRRLTQFYDVIIVRLFDLEHILGITDGVYRRMRSIEQTVLLRVVAFLLYILAMLFFVFAALVGFVSIG